MGLQLARSRGPSDRVTCRNLTGGELATVGELLGDAPEAAIGVLTGPNRNLDALLDRAIGSDVPWLTATVAKAVVVGDAGLGAIGRKAHGRRTCRI